MTDSQFRILSETARAAMSAFGLQVESTADATQELATIVEPAHENGLRDLRELLWVSIDNDASLDLDQLTVAESLAEGRVRLLVAVSDVDAVVKKESAIDRDARRNASTVYTDALIFPMLPEQLSTGLTSLNEGTDRIAIVTDMVFASDGSMESSTIYRAVVRNHKKLAYAAVGLWLAGESSVPVGIAEIAGLTENLLLQDATAQLLEKVRHQRGALSLETNDPPVTSIGSILSDLDSFRPNRAEQVIENCMIAANRASTAYLQSKRFPSFRRILRSPKRWDRLVQLAAGYHQVLPPVPDSVALENFLVQRQRADPPKFADLSLSVVKLIGHGEYMVDVPGIASVGHFGLAIKNYAHATAPNRRFADLVTQRLLKAALADAPVPYTIEELTGLAQHCTSQEISVTKVERHVHESEVARH